MSFRKILCPVDFSDAASEAVRYADALAERFQGEVTLLHVAPPIDFDYALAQPSAELLSAFTEQRTRIVRRTLDIFGSELGLTKVASRRLAEGEAADEILRLAHQDRYDLIVMPTHGAGAIRRWLLVGSVTTKVLQRAECPVIAGVHFGRHPLRLRRMLCAVDLGPQSTRVLCFGAGLARELGATMTVVHAVPGPGEAAEDFFDEDWRLTLKCRLRERIAELQKQTGAVGDIVVENGDPHRVVARLADESAADLVVIGRGVSGGLLGRLRAHAFEIVRQSPCPVLSV